MELLSSRKVSTMTKILCHKDGLSSITVVAQIRILLTLVCINQYSPLFLSMSTPCKHHYQNKLNSTSDTLKWFKTFSSLLCPLYLKLMTANFLIQRTQKIEKQMPLYFIIIMYNLLDRTLKQR